VRFCKWPIYVDLCAGHVYDGYSALIVETEDLGSLSFQSLVSFCEGYISMYTVCKRVLEHQNQYAYSGLSIVGLFCLIVLLLPLKSL